MGIGLSGTLDEADRPTQVLGVTDLDRARVAQGLVDQDVGERSRLAAGGEVDRLDQDVLALTRQRLGEARDGAAHHRRGTLGVVAVSAAEPGCRDEEGLVLAQRAHRGGQQLDPNVQPLAPGGGFEVRDVTLLVEGREPVDAVDRPTRSPGLDLGLELLDRRSALDLQHLDSQLGEAPAQRRTDAT